MTDGKRPTSRLRAKLALAVFLVGAVALVRPARGGDDQDFICEEAAAHLSDCCGVQFEPSLLNCSFDYGCDFDGEQAELPSSQSQCIADADCATLEENGFCTNTLVALEGPLCP